MFYKHVVQFPTKRIRYVFDLADSYLQISMGYEPSSNGIFYHAESSTPYTNNELYKMIVRENANCNIYRSFMLRQAINRNIEIYN